MTGVTFYSIFFQRSAPDPLPAGPDQMSPEEQRILRECNRESFFHRAMPLSILGGLGVFAAGKQGLLRPSPNYGMGPKIAIGSILGYFVGKFSYVNECADKFLTQAPDSHIADAIRQRRGLPPRCEGTFNVAKNYIRL